ncbi:MAG: hypothetical protein WC755_04715 [Candidatus Woesearchaeota archaeon]|jgi:hypothetical protein
MTSYKGYDLAKVCVQNMNRALPFGIITIDKKLSKSSSGGSCVESEYNLYFTCPEVPKKVINGMKRNPIFMFTEVEPHNYFTKIGSLYTNYTGDIPNTGKYKGLVPKRNDLNLHLFAPKLISRAYNKTLNFQLRPYVNGPGLNQFKGKKNLNDFENI